MSKVRMHTWAHIARQTLRMRVPGGWLYRYEASGDFHAVCFVPLSFEQEIEPPWTAPPPLTLHPRTLSDFDD